MGFCTLGIMRKNLYYHYDVASGSEITSCNTIDNTSGLQMFGKRFGVHDSNVAYIMTKCQKWDLKVIWTTYDKSNVTFVLLYY